MQQLSLLIRKMMLGILLVASFSTLSNAQIQIGGGLSYGTQIEELGFNARLNVNVTEAIRISGSINYFLPQTVTIFTEEIKTTFWTANLDGHYVFDVGPEFLKLYALLGIKE